MIKYRALLVVSLLIVALAACRVQGVPVAGSGQVAAQEYSLSGFDRVEAGAAFHVDIRQSESYQVVVRIDENLVRCLDVRLEGRTLRVGFKAECWVSGATTMEAEIAMPALVGLNLSGASQGVISGFKSERPLELEVSGASAIRGDIEAGDVTAEISGASSLQLDGRGSDLKLNVSGASRADLAGFRVRDADVEVSGASNATVAPSGRLDVEASGASHVYYLGSPTMGRVDVSGGSAVESK